MPEEKLPIGTLGISLEDIDTGETGQAYFPDLNLRAEVYAVENIRKHRDIIIVGANNQAKEHSPVELSYQTIEGKWQRVTEEYPLPVDGAYVQPASIRATSSGDTKVVEPAAGKKLRIKYIEVFNSGSTSVTVYLKMGTTGEAYFKKNLAPQTGFNCNLIGANWRGGVDEPLYINLSASGTVDCTVMYQESDS